MLTPLFLHQLDEALHRGCDTPGCAHDHSGALFLTPRCHPGVGVRVEQRDVPHGLPCGAAVSLRCWKCLAPVVQVKPPHDLRYTSVHFSRPYPVRSNSNSTSCCVEKALRACRRRV